MMSATSQNPKHIRKQIGSALWLLAVLANSTPADWTGDKPVWIANGNAISDAELAELLGAPLGTIANWRRKLRAAGLISWLVAPGRGRVFSISALAGVLETPSASKPADNPETPEAETGPRPSSPQRYVQ